jgi:hypothetical protein
MIVIDENSPVMVRVGTDGAMSVVPLVLDEFDSAASALCYQIGCRIFALSELSEAIDVWTDEEILVYIDRHDPASLTGVINTTATRIATRLGQALPVLGTAVFTSREAGRTIGLSGEQIAALEHLALASPVREVLTSEEVA